MDPTLRALRAELAAAEKQIARVRRALEEQGLLPICRLFPCLDCGRPSPSTTRLGRCKACYAARPAMQGRWCPDCRKALPLTSFYPNRSKRSGYTGYCRRCHLARNRGLHLIAPIPARLRGVQ